MDVLLVAIGLALLFAGGEFLVRGASGLALRVGLSPAVVGLTVVGFGTSMPELLVSVRAALAGAPDIAMGNVVGSNIANVLLIVGVAALMCPIATRDLGMGRDTLWMIGASAIVFVPAALGLVSRPMALMMLAALVLYLALSLKAATAASQDAPPSAKGLATIALAIAFGLLALVVGARLLVDGASSLARGWGLSEAFIGLTIVAVGTSLPELATSVVAALRRESAIAVGNVVGSNIFNVLGILGVTALVAPVPVAPRFLVIDVPVMLATAIGLAILLRGGRVGRLWGGALVLTYGAYVMFAMAQPA